jgi:DNA-binding NtrC family response regulator
MWRTLVVDDCTEARRVILEKLRGHDFQVFQATDAFDALTCFPEARPDLVITDLRMPGADGIELLRRIREFSEVPVIVLTSYPTIPTCETALLSGAQRFLQWREDLGNLANVARDLLEGGEKPSHAEPVVAGVSPARERRREEFRTHLETLVRECHGNISQIAERLHKDRSTVTYHLKRFGLFEPRRNPKRRGSRTRVEIDARGRR